MINVPRKTIPKLKNERIVVDTNKDIIRRYFALRYDGQFYEITKQTYQSVKDSPFFDFVLINWYIRGTEQFVVSQNRKQVDQASIKIPRISSVLVNLKQYYVDDN